jgi:hypothetical protein
MFQLKYGKKHKITACYFVLFFNNAKSIYLLNLFLAKAGRLLSYLRFSRAKKKKNKVIECEAGKLHQASPQSK